MRVIVLGTGEMGSAIARLLLEKPGLELAGAFARRSERAGTDLGPTEDKEIHIEAVGEQPLKAVDVIRDGEVFQRFRPNAVRFTTDIKTNEPGAFWYVRVTQIDNHIAYSSPIWTT